MAAIDEPLFGVTMVAVKRFEFVSYEDASLEVREIYDDIMKTMGMPFVINWFKCQGGNPNLLRGNWAKVKYTLCSGQVPMLLKQLILFKVSRERGCKYCTFLHKTTSDSLGKELCTDEGWAVSENLDSAHVPSSFKVGVEVVSRLALDPLATTDDDFELLRDEGFSELEIQELMAQADLINMLNTIADISGIEIDAEFLGSAS